MQLGNPLRALLCVGMAYFLVGVLVPAAALGSQGELKGFNSDGVFSSTLGGALGAVGPFASSGRSSMAAPRRLSCRSYSGLAPLINVLFTMAMHPPKTAPNPLLYLGYLLASAGVWLVLRYKPANRLDARSETPNRR